MTTTRNLDDDEDEDLDDDEDEDLDEIQSSMKHSMPAPSKRGNCG